MRRVSPRRNRRNNSVGDAGKPYRVALLNRHPTDRGCQSPAVFNLCDVLRTESHRAAGVEHQAATQIRVGFEFLNVKAVGSAVGSPIKPPEIVARHVLAILGELDTRPTTWTGMPPR